MKFIYFLFSTAMLFAISSCHIDEKIAFNIDYDSEATIPSAIGINIPFEIPIPPITTNINKKLSSNNSKAEFLNTAFLKEITISAIDPSDQSFNFLKKVEIYIKADGLDEIKIAEKQDIPEDLGNILTLDIFDTKDISEYIKKDEFNLKVKATSRKILLHSTKINIYSVIRITTDIF